MQLRDLVPSLARYNSAIRGCTQEGEWEMAVSLVLGACRHFILYIWARAIYHSTPTDRPLPFHNTVL